MRRCAFPFERCQLQLDHLLLASLDAVRAADPTYPVRVPEMLRFGIMHNRSVAIGKEESVEDALADTTPLGWEES